MSIRESKSLEAILRVAEEVGLDTRPDYIASLDEAYADGLITRLDYNLRLAAYHLALSVYLENGGEG